MVRSSLRAWGVAAMLGFACGCALDPSGFGSEGPPAPVDPSGTGTTTGTPEDPGTSTTASEAVDSSTSGRPNDATTSSTGDPPPSDGSSSDDGGTTETGGPKVAVHCMMNVNATIPDNDPVGVSSTLDVPETGTIVDLRVELQIAHTFVGDLRVALLGNAGQVALVDRPDFGNCAGDDIDATLHDAAPNTVDDVCMNGGSPALLGEVRPDGQLGPMFVGTAANGSWRLQAIDAYGGDEGVLQSWCLHVTYE